MWTFQSIHVDLVFVSGSPGINYNRWPRIRGSLVELEHLGTSSGNLEMQQRGFRTTSENGLQFPLMAFVCTCMSFGILGCNEAVHCHCSMQPHIAECQLVCYVRIEKHNLHWLNFL